MTIAPIPAQLDDPRLALHTRHRLEEYEAILGLPVDCFIGIDERGAALLGSLAIHDVFGLAHAPVFGAAQILVTAAAEASHPFHQIGRVADPLVDGDGTQLPVEDWPTQPVRLISGLGPVLAPQFEDVFDLTTIGDLAVWQPYRSAVEIARRAAGGAIVPAQDPGTPVDLLPQNGQYPTDKVYYRSLLLREFADADGGVALESSSGLDLGLGAGTASTGIGYGAYVTWEQLWYGQGLVLGNLLHSLALAPGEATMVAIVDWTRSVTASTAETVEQLEALQASTSQNRALSEVTQGVTSEVQGGFSTNLSTGSTHSTGGTTGGAASATVPVSGVPVSLGGGFGLSSGTSSTTASSITVASTSGTRETFAEYGQQISESTQQQASSARSRRASVVQEVRETTSEQLQTRVVANYNHMHALSICYYEIVQIYRVVLQASRVEKCSFVPMTPLDFADDAVIEQFAPTLREVARDPYLAKVLATSIRASLVAPVSGAVYERFASLGLDLLTRVGGRVVAASARTGGTPTGQTGQAGQAEQAGQAGQAGQTLPTRDLETPYVRATYTIPGPLQVSPTSRITFAEATADGHTFGITVTFVDGLAQSYSGGEVSWAVLDVESLIVNIPLSLDIEELELEVGVSTGTTEQRYRITMGTSAGESDDTINRVTALVVVGGDVSATDLALAKAHLVANAAWYTARIWERLDTTSVSALLGRYRYEGKPLLSRIDPRVLTVTGTHVVFRMLLDDDARRRWARELDEWGLTGPESRREDLVPLPTGGVFAEAVLGRANSAEPLDITRFWNWQESPPPFAPPAIAALQAGQQSPTDAPGTGSLDSSLISMVQPNPLPDPTGLAATLGLLQAAGIFRDMSFGSETVGAAGAAAAVSAAAEAAALNAAQYAFATAASLVSPTMTGALMNAAGDGLPGAIERLVPLPSPPGTTDPGTGSSGGSGSTGDLADGDGGTPSGSTGSGTTGTGGEPTGQDPIPSTGDGGGTPATGAAIRKFHLRVSVPYEMVRLSGVDLLRDAIPDELIGLVGTPLEMMFAWQQDFGLDTEIDSVEGMIRFLESYATGIGELALVYEALAGIVDFVGLENLVSEATFNALVTKASELIRLIQAVFFPAISGGTWLDTTVHTAVAAEGGPDGGAHDGVALPFLNTQDITYGLLSTVDPVAGAPWWAGKNGTLFMSTSATVAAGEIHAEATAIGDGSYRVSITGGPRLAFDWGTVLRNQVPAAQALVNDIASLVAAETGLVDQLIAHTGMSFATLVTDLVAGVADWFEWWIDSFYTPLNELFQPQVDFAFEVLVTPNSLGQWSLITTPVHDNFPVFRLTAVGPDDDEYLLYEGMEGLSSSAEGPLALVAPTVATHPASSLSVTADWFDTWS